MKTILKIRNICKEHHSCYDNCPFHVDNECVLSIPPANWSDENLYLISKALKGELQLEQEPTTKNDLAVDCVSRQFMYELGATCIATRNENGELIALGAIEELPSVAPQEPQSFKWCTDCKEYDQEKHCCHRWSKVIRDTIEEMKQEYIEREVLDKIRAEIVELTKCPYGTECLGTNCPSNTDCMICGDHVLEIIDKYKVESEG